MVNNLKYYRKLKGYSQEQLANIVGVSRNTISSIECNQYLPGCELFLKLVYALQANVISLNYDQFIHIKEMKAKIKKKKH